MNILKFVFFFLIGVLPSNIILGQSYDYTKREIIVNTPDSLVKTSIWNKNDKRKIDADFTYYWYYAGAINHNVGGYSGKLLHGIYEVFDNQQRLKTQGIFNFGLMKGTWYRWHSNGNIYFLGFYKNGLLQGKANYYALDGKLVSVLRYRKGKLNGKSYFFLKDTIVTKKYRDGMEIIKIRKMPAKKSDKNIESKNADVEKSAKTNLQQDQLKTKEIDKKKWWQFSFRKKKNKGIQEAKSKSLLKENKKPEKVSSQPKGFDSKEAGKKKWWQFSFLKKKKEEQEVKK